MGAGTGFGRETSALYNGASCTPWRVRPTLLHPSCTSTSSTTRRGSAASSSAPGWSIFPVSLSSFSQGCTRGPESGFDQVCSAESRAVQGHYAQDHRNLAAQGFLGPARVPLPRDRPRAFDATELLAWTLGFPGSARVPELDNFVHVTVSLGASVRLRYSRAGRPVGFPVLTGLQQPFRQATAPVPVAPAGTTHPGSAPPH